MPIDSEPSFPPPSPPASGIQTGEFALSGEGAGMMTIDSTAAPSATPNLGHTMLFGVLVLVAFMIIGAGFGMMLKYVMPHLHETTEQMKNDPRLVIPIEALAYAIAAGGAFLVLPLFWRRSFGEGVHWRSQFVLRRWWVLAGIGVITSVGVQALSNFLPIPKELPIDKLFTQSVGVWLIAIFGVTVAPAFEELAFRGFLLPSLASAWDWVVARGRRTRAIAPADTAQLSADAAFQSPVALSPQASPTTGDGGRWRTYGRMINADRGADAAPDAAPDPSWSLPALIFGTVITSIGFALMHGAQLAHSFAPLAVLFVVSVVLCLTRLVFHSLAASTLVHSFYNATIFVMLFIGTDGFRHLEKLNK
jgi:membrane protease YdiL (CAAX protease family)